MCQARAARGGGSLSPSGAPLGRRQLACGLSHPPLPHGLGLGLLTRLPLHLLGQAAASPAPGRGAGPQVGCWSHRGVHSRRAPLIAPVLLGGNLGSTEPVFHPRPGGASQRLSPAPARRGRRRRGVLQPRAMVGRPKSTRFCWYELRTTARAEARAFYAEVVGADIREEAGRQLLTLPERAAAMGAPCPQASLTRVTSMP